MKLEGSNVGVFGKPKLLHNYFPISCPPKRTIFISRVITIDGCTEIVVKWTNMLISILFTHNQLVDLQTSLSNKPKNDSCATNGVATALLADFLIFGRTYGHTEDIACPSIISGRARVQSRC